MKRFMLFLLAGVLILAASLAAFYYRPETILPPSARIDRIVVEKSKRRMHVYQGDDLLKSYRISLGFEPEGHKQMQGDGRTPEGSYQVLGRNEKSIAYKSLRISYPNDHDRSRARDAGVDPGGDIMIHGLMNGYGRLGRFHRWRDWTGGCIAVTNEEMDELFDSVPLGTPIEIRK